MKRTITVAFLRDIDPTRGDRVNPRNRVEWQAQAGISGMRRLSGVGQDVIE